MTIVKWLPLESEQEKHLYLEYKELRIKSDELFEMFGKFLNEFKSRNISKLHYNISENDQLMEVSEFLLALIITM